MNTPSDKDYAAEYLALRAANDQLRERGKQWLWETLSRLCAQVNRGLVDSEQMVQIGRQEWQFKVENATMVGERFGLRYRASTLTVEVGWPRAPQHGFVSDGGLARARVGFSQNTMIDAQPIAELILKRQGESEPVWLTIKEKRLGELVTEPRLQTYLNLLLSD